MALMKQVPGSPSPPPAPIIERLWDGFSGASPAARHLKQAGSTHQRRAALNVCPHSNNGILETSAFKTFVRELCVCVGGYSDPSRIMPPLTVFGCESAGSSWVFILMIDSVVKLCN